MDGATAQRIPHEGSFVVPSSGHQVRIGSLERPGEHDVLQAFRTSRRRATRSPDADAAAADWQSLRPDGSSILDVRLDLETEDGAPICMTCQGLRHGPGEVLARLDRGEEVDPTSYCFRIGPMHRFADGPIHHVFEVP